MGTRGADLFMDCDTPSLERTRSRKQLMTGKWLRNDYCTRGTVAWGYEGVRIWAKRPGAKTLEGSKADLRRRMRARSEREEPQVLTRGLKVVGAKRRAVSPPTAERDSKIWVEDSARRPAVSSFALGGSRAK